MSQDRSDTASPEATQTASAPRDRGTFVPLIFGGAVAAGLGFFGGQIESIERALGLADDPAMQQQIDQHAELLAQNASTMADQAALIETLRTEIRSVPTPVDASAVQAQLDELGAAVGGLADRFGTVESRVMADGASPEETSAISAEFDRLKSELDAQRAEIQTLVEDARNSDLSAAKNAQTALARAALARVMAAVDSGAPYADALSDLTEVEGVEVSGALTSLASEGVPTLARLQADIPDAARSALAAVRANASATGNGGFQNFLQRQLGARSVTPQDGDDPDAVLSRVEAAITQGRLGDALAETQTLPDLARDAMADWISLAETRHDAMVAAQQLLADLNSN